VPPSPPICDRRYSPHPSGGGRDAAVLPLAGGRFRGAVPPEAKPNGGKVPAGRRPGGKGGRRPQVERRRVPNNVGGCVPPSPPICDRRYSPHPSGGGRDASQPALVGTATLPPPAEERRVPNNVGGAGEITPPVLRLAGGRLRRRRLWFRGRPLQPTPLLPRSGRSRNMPSPSRSSSPRCPRALPCH